MKLIAVDLDGTLLNHSKEVLESSRQAIAAAAAAGVQVVVASGRSFPEAQRFVAGTACSEHVICAGGAAIVNRTSGVSRHTWYLDCQTAARVLRQGAACGMAAFAYTANQIWMEEADYNAIFSNMPGFRAQRDILHLCDGLPEAIAAHGMDVAKIMCWGLDQDRQRQTRAHLSAIPGLSFTSSGPDNFEVLVAGAGKGMALRWLAQALGIPREETAAIGDAENDLDMLAEAGYAVAMGNAAACVKAQADFVTGDCESDGIARALTWLMERNM